MYCVISLGIISLITLLSMCGRPLAATIPPERASIAGNRLTDDELLTGLAVTRW